MKTLRLLTLVLVAVAAMLFLVGKTPAQDPKADLTYMEAEESRLNLEYTLGFLPPGDPTIPPNNIWHEIWPVFCREYELTSWEDNDNDGELSRCDQIDMIPVGGGPVEWYHVENVTITIWWEGLLKQDMGAADFTGSSGAIQSMLQDPVCTWWHVIYPPEHYCREFHIASWIDNGNGELDSCDLIDRDNLSWAPGVVDTVHIRRVATNITLRRKYYNPESTQWHELYPNYCVRWHLDDWIDNGTGKLDVCDYIKMYRKPNPADTTWYHIDGITKTIFVRKKPDFVDSLYMEYIGTHGPAPPKGMTQDTLITDPVGTWWHEIWPNFCQVYRCDSWDDNGNGYLDPSDQIDLTRIIPPGANEDYHVERVATDIILKKRSPFPTPSMTEWGLIVLFVLLISSGVFIALRRRKRAIPA
jgi:hypothetical protein